MRRGRARRRWRGDRRHRPSAAGAFNCSGSLRLRCLGSSARAAAEGNRPPAPAWATGNTREWGRRSRSPRAVQGDGRAAFCRAELGEQRLPGMAPAPKQPRDLRQPTPAEPCWSRGRKSCSEQLQMLPITRQMPDPSQLFKDASIRALGVHLGLLSSAPGYNYPSAPPCSFSRSIGIPNTSLVLPIAALLPVTPKTLTQGPRSCSISFPTPQNHPCQWAGAGMKIKI